MSWTVLPRFKEKQRKREIRRETERKRDVPQNT